MGVLIPPWKGAILDVHNGRPIVMNGDRICGIAMGVIQGARVHQNLERGDTNTNPPRFRLLLSNPDPAIPT